MVSTHFPSPISRLSCRATVQRQGCGPCLRGHPSYSISRPPIVTSTCPQTFHLRLPVLVGSGPGARTTAFLGFRTLRRFRAITDLHPPEKFFTRGCSWLQSNSQVKGTPGLGMSPCPPPAAHSPPVLPAARPPPTPPGLVCTEKLGCIGCAPECIICFCLKIIKSVNCLKYNSFEGLAPVKSIYLLSKLALTQPLPL